jgi:hypothetical protein
VNLIDQLPTISSEEASRLLSADLASDLGEQIMATAAHGPQHTGGHGERSRRRRLIPGAVSGLAVVAAMAVVLGLGLSGTFGSAPAPGTGTIRTAAFTLVEHANGTATLTINLFELLDAAALKSDLQQDGIPALVTSGSFCSSHPALAGFSQVVSSPPPKLGERLTITINPAAMPAGTELSFGVFQLGTGGRQADSELINTSSYSCTSTPPSPPPGHVNGIFLQVGPAGS